MNRTVKIGGTAVNQMPIDWKSIVANVIEAAKKRIGPTSVTINSTHTYYYDDGGLVVGPDAQAYNQANENFVQSVDYRYNIRGWMSSMNNSGLVTDGGATNDDTNDLFGMNLLYNQTDAGLGNTVQYNGNISAIKWNNFLGQASVKERGYIFSYDALNRLLAANHRERTAAWVASSSFHENGLGYDLNGNITTLARKGAAGLNMDQLTYTYSGNRLQTVVDAGDITKGFADGNVGSTDYTYDANGNMALDNNKDVASITYNHLNLPAQVTKKNGEYVKYAYDATGRKLRQDVYLANGTLKKRSGYAGEFFYENDTLKFINHEEGRVVMAGTTPEYQYHLKDHLGNVRLTFTSKDETDNATATNEATNAIAEQGKFLHRDKVRSINSTLFDHTYDGQPAQPNGTFAQRLSGRDNEKIGLARSLSVMPGDRVNIEVFAKYYDPSASNDAGLANLMNAIILGVNVPAGTFVDGAGYGQTTNLPFTPGWGTKDGSGAPPMAYLNWLVFDRNYVQDLSRSGYKRITSNSKETGTNVAHDRLAPDNEIVIAEAGYMYIWLSNENPTPVEVYFDDLKVSQTKSPVVQQDDYYPFGLTFNSYQRENSIRQDYTYNGKELQDELGLDWLDFGARMYMPEIGRWGGVDPKSELMEISSPFVYALNSPIIYVDKDGELPIFINGRVGDNSERGSAKYWGNEILNTIANSGIPNPGGERHFVDGDRYQEEKGGVMSGTYWNGNSSSERQAAGYTVGKADFKNILSQLKKDPKTGKIIEKIQIYTHSRGAAFGIGYTEALLQEIKKNADLFEDADNVIDFVYNMAPHQSNSLTSPEGVDAYTHDHTGDLLSGDDMKGVKAAFKSNEKGSGTLLRSHAISGFVKDVSGFLDAFKNNKGSSTRLINDFVRTMRVTYGIKVTVN